VARRKALAAVLEKVTIVDTDGNTVDLNELNERPVAEDAAEDVAEDAAEGVTEDAAEGDEPAGDDSKA
jgi:trigger factor